ncbi:DUF6325 family protein [Actinomycetospora endophytica]|uniref:DUF6325 family protein n=1 Tax=Actinomycetospora endophytica TaxID=2291215 RepID=A0ABS8PAY9_9PSEU|nr:DUF6325 family protein [Actinomycetospora endophytica]MCD2195421.1 DUF6325 family protein [Actinomycetospora endophytica]
MTDDAPEMGPVDYLVMEFATERMTGESLPMLVDLVEAGTIRVLDLAFVRRELDGTVAGLTIDEVDAEEGLDLTVFEGAGSGLVDRDDLDEAGRVLEPGRAAVLVVYENTWAAPLVGALRRSGAQVVAGGRIPHDLLLDAITAAEMPA